jgi:hypothetical protein
MPVKGLSPDQVFDSLILATGNRDNPRVDPNRFFQFNSPRSAFQQKFAVQDKSTEYQTSIPQALALMNNPLIATATQPEKGETLAAIASSPFLDTAGKVEALYFSALSRKPTQEESGRLRLYVDQDTDREKRKPCPTCFGPL